MDKRPSVKRADSRQNRTGAHRPPSSGSWRSWLSGRGKLVIAAALLILVVWGLWPSPYANVANLRSRGTNIIAFGDSLTAGMGASEGEDYPSRLSRIIGAPVMNAGVSGDTTDMALARLEPAVLSHDPRIVIVGLGGNDFLQGVAISTTEANLRIIIRRIHGAGAMVVLLGFGFPSINVNYETMYAGLAREERCLLIPHPLRGVLTDPALKSDGIHPNARGYQLMAERLSGPCRKLISKANAAR